MFPAFLHPLSTVFKGKLSPVADALDPTNFIHKQVTKQLPSSVTKPARAVLDVWQRNAQDAQDKIAQNIKPRGAARAFTLLGPTDDQYGYRYPSVR